MSTRAGIIIKDKYDEIHFYRHSDGYPEGTLPTLELFLSWVKDRKIRDNAMQASGWLVIIGALEYMTVPRVPVLETKFGLESDMTKANPPDDWKCGAYEPTTNVENHGDLEFVYIVDLDTKEITYSHG